jgi:hypothetical protein
VEHKLLTSGAFRPGAIRAWQIVEGKGLEMIIAWIIIDTMLGIYCSSQIHIYPPIIPPVLPFHALVRNNDGRPNSDPK